VTRVLVADDDTSVRDIVTTVLEIIGGWEAEAVEDGADALARLSDDTRPLPDLVVLDVMMPRLDGLAVLAWIREHEYLYDLPVVLLTARAGQADETAGWHQGCDAFVAKPFEPMHLVEVVETTLAAGPELRIARRRQRLQELLSAP
jgi:CheY-like chemotaxis protein